MQRGRRVGGGGGVGGGAPRVVGGWGGGGGGGGRSTDLVPFTAEVEGRGSPGPHYRWKFRPIAARRPYDRCCSRSIPNSWGAGSTRRTVSRFHRTRSRKIRAEESIECFEDEGPPFFDLRTSRPRSRKYRFTAPPPASSFFFGRVSNDGPKPRDQKKKIFLPLQFLEPSVTAGP